MVDFGSTVCTSESPSRRIEAYLEARRSHNVGTHAYTGQNARGYRQAHPTHALRGDDGFEPSSNNQFLCGIGKHHLEGLGNG